MANQRQKLMVFDRSIIEVRLREGWGIRAIARNLAGAPGMICDEINRHGGRAAYQAQTAAAQSEAARRLSGRKPRMAQDGVQFGEVWRCCTGAGHRSRYRAGASGWRRV